jgi:hypothetical protein
MKRPSMQPRRGSSPTVREGSARTYSKAQNDLRKEFCEAYNFAPEQISFDGPSLDPIFDFDALALLSTKLCDLPQIDLGLGSVDRVLGLATAVGIVMLPNGSSRKIFAAAQVGELMPDGEPIKDINQAINISRARALRNILRAVGFNPVAAHRVFTDSEGTQMLELVPVDPRLKQLAEIHLHAQALDLIVVGPNGFLNKERYQQRMSMVCDGKTSCRDLTDEQRAQWLQCLRAWSKAANLKRSITRNRNLVAQAV